MTAAYFFTPTLLDRSVLQPRHDRLIGRTSKTKTCVLRCFSRAPALRIQDGDVPPPEILNQPSRLLCFVNQGAFGAWFPRDGSRMCYSFVTRSQRLVGGGGVWRADMCYQIEVPGHLRSSYRWVKKRPRMVMRLVSLTLNAT
jgi:hypothetical protein